MLGSVGIDRRLIYNVDVVLIATTLVLSMVGVAMVYSATHAGRQLVTTFTTMTSMSTNSAAPISPAATTCTGLMLTESLS